MKMNNKGMTLVETMVGFMLMVIIMVTLTKIVKLSSELTASAADAKTTYEAFEKAYFNGYNYKTKDSKTAFRTTGNEIITDGAVELSEVVYDSTKKDYVKSTVDGTYSKILNNVVLWKIENILDMDIARMSTFRYYRKPVATE